MTTGQAAAGFILYSTPACHLCEVAEQMLLEQVEPALEFSKVDVSECEELMARYGVRIPVLRHPDGRELGWPFSPGQLAGFVAG